MIFEGKIFSALLWASRESRNQMVQQSLNLGANGGKPLCRSGDLRARSTSYVQIDRLIRHGIGAAIFLFFFFFWGLVQTLTCWMTPTPHQWDQWDQFFGHFTSWNDTLFWKYPHGSISLSRHPLALSSQHFKLAILPDFTANRPADSGKMRAIKSWVVFCHTSKIWGLFLSST